MPKAPKENTVIFTLNANSMYGLDRCSKEAASAVMAFQEAAAKAKEIGQPVRIKLGNSAKRIFSRVGKQGINIVTSNITDRELGENAMRVMLADQGYREPAVNALVTDIRPAYLCELGEILRKPAIERINTRGDTVSNVAHAASRMDSLGGLCKVRVMNVQFGHKY